MGVRNLDRIFRPRRIALLGAADRPGNLGLGVLTNLLAERFPGVVYVVDPDREAIRGIPTSPDVASLPHVPDLALVCSPAAAAVEAVQTCAEAGVLGVVVLSGGFREAGEAGAELERRLRGIATAHPGLRILGPNSLGVIVPRHGLNASHSVTRPRPGHLAFVSESRALCNSVIDWAAEEGIGFSCFVSIGQMLDVGFGDAIDYLSSDPDTRAIILYVQSIQHARSFTSAARAFARLKPIVAYKAGRFEESARVAALHTGAMVAEDAVYEAAFERAGVVRVAELDEIFDVAEVLASNRVPRGPRLAILGNAGGPSVIATDALLSRGGLLATLGSETRRRLDEVLPAVGSHANPVDLLDSAPPERFGQALRILLQEPDADAVLVVFATQAGVDPLATARVVVEAIEGSRKPVLAAWMGGDRVRAGVRVLNEAGMATHSTPEQAVRAFMHLVSYARNLETLYETPRDIPVRFDRERRELRERLAPLLDGPERTLAEDQAKTFLAAYGIPVTESHVATSPEQAVEIAQRIGYPVVLKVRAPGIVHKFDVGGVALDLAGADEVRAAWDRMAASAADPRIAPGVTVQRMVIAENAFELILGSKKDPTFGAVIMIGIGGIGADVLRDRALGFPPLNERLARRMLESLRSWPMLCGYRGQPAIDQDRLIEAIIRFSCLITDCPEIDEFDVNPLLVSPHDVVALDAAAVLEEDRGGPAGDPYAHLAIRPYPEEYEREARLADSTAIRLRAVRAEDEPLWHDLIARTSASSLHSRFRSFFHSTTHTMAVQYCVIDYEREIAIVAERTGEGDRELIGIAQVVADAGHQSAEFAVLVADAWHGHGVGGLLLDYCLELARRWGIERVVAETEPQNRPMLAVFRKRGFRSDVHYEESTVYLEKHLR